MENASKALLMAGGVLISIVIISMLMLVANSLTGYQQASVETKRESDIFSFNQQYEGYKRAGVRGNELFSLISKSIDYNYRESSLVSTTDQFEPMTIVFNLGDADLTKDGTARLFKLGKGDYTYTKSNYSESLINDTMDEINKLLSQEIPKSYCNNEDLKNTVSSFHFTEASLDRLVTAYDNIFIDTDNWDSFTADLHANIINKNKKIVNDQSQIFYNFNSAFGMEFFKVPDYSKVNLSTLMKFKSMWKNLNSDEIKEAVNTYYEYVQFKRAIFDCDVDSVRYSNTGRIVYMKFNFTGKYN